MSRLLLSAMIAIAILATPAEAARRSLRDIISEIMVRAVEDHVQPGYAHFSTAAESLEREIGVLCAGPDMDRLAAARAAFSRAVIAWSQIELVGFGPVAAENRLERVLFYPDPRGTGLRQVQAMFAGSGAFPQKIEDLQRKSVALQGFPALEFALFGTGSQAVATPDPDGAARCAYASLVAQNIAGIAEALDAEWNDPRGAPAIWMKPGASNPVLRDSREAIVSLLGVMVHGFETVRDIRLRNFLGDTPDTDRPRLAVHRRSGNTMASIAANLEGLQSLFDTSGMALVLPDDKKGVAVAVDAKLQEAIGIARGLGADIEAVLADPESRARLAALRDLVGELKVLLNEDYSGAVGLSAGFSFADGD